MNVNEHDPQSWGLFLKFKDRATRTEFAKAAKYRARYKLATNFRYLPLDGVSQATAESYFVLVKLAFAYSAVEALEYLTGKNSVAIEDSAFHEALQKGELKRFMDHLVKAANSLPRPTDNELESFLNTNPPQNLRPIVKHSRHVVFHASITPSAIGLQNSRVRRSLILGLANETLASSEKALEVFAQNLRQRPRKS